MNKIAKRLVKIARDISALEVKHKRKPRKDKQPKKELTTEQKIQLFFREPRGLFGSKLTPYKKLKRGELEMSSDELKQLQDEIIKRRDAGHAVNFAKYIKGADIKKLQDVIIEEKHISAARSFALLIEGADIKKLQDVVMKFGDPMAWVSFAVDIKGADIKKLQELVIKSNDAFEIFQFARYVKSPDIDTDKLYEAIKKTGDKKWLKHFQIEVLKDKSLSYEDWEL